MAGSAEVRVTVLSTSKHAAGAARLAREVNLS